MKSSAIVATMLVFWAPALGLCQTVGNVTASGGAFFDDDGDNDVYSGFIGVTGESGLTERLTLGHDLSFQYADSDGDSVELAIGALELDYLLDGGFTLGGYLEGVYLDADGEDATFWSGGATAGYSWAAGRSVEAFVGATDGDEVDETSTDFGVTAAIEPGGDWSAWAVVARSEVSGDADATSGGLAGAYDLSSDWTLFGGASYTHLSTDGEDVDVFSLGVGASYSFELGSLPVAVAAELSRSDIDADGSIGVTGLQVSLVVPFGERPHNAVPASSLANAIRNPLHSAVLSELRVGF